MIYEGKAYNVILKPKEHERFYIIERTAIKDGITSHERVEIPEKFVEIISILNAKI